MKIRYVLAASSALALAATATLVSAAHADDPTYEADVGGGAAGITAVVTNQSYALDPLFDNNDVVQYTVVTPRVEMGKNGGTYGKRVLSQKVAGLWARAVEVTVKGNRFGTPYAEARSVATDLSFVGGALKGTKIGTVESYCKWDRSGWVASTTIIDANGTKYQPAVNQEIPLGDLGVIRLNEQYTDQVYLKDANGHYIYDANGNALYSETVYVIGAHISLDADLSDLPIDLDNHDDIYVGFTSCDPLNIPPLGGLKLTQTST